MQIEKLLGSPDPFLLEIFGSPGSGKSYLIKYLVYTLAKNYDYIILYTKNKFNGEYDYLPANFIVDTDIEDHILKVMDTQVKLNLEGKTKKGLLIFDDIVGTVKFQSQIYDQLLTLFRKFPFDIILSLQYVNKLSTTGRECATHCISFLLGSELSKKALYTNFASSDFESYKHLNKYMIDNLDREKHEFFFWTKGKNNGWQVLKCPGKLPPFQVLISNPN